jgi:predicted small secreted protein
MLPMRVDRPADAASRGHGAGSPAPSNAARPPRAPEAATMTTRHRIHPLLLATFALLVGALPGCNTMHGIGKDTERAGEKIQKESDRHRDGGHHDDDRESASNG